MFNKALAEFFGTFILVFFGVGSAVLMGAHIGFHGIAIAFGSQSSLRPMGWARSRGRISIRRCRLASWPRDG